LRVFWLKGYDGASLSDLTKAMRINRSSMYAAFGNKDQLYCKTLERYSKSRNEHLSEFLAAPTARKDLHRVVDLYWETWPPRAAGSGKSGRVDGAAVDTRA
jgi:AcrR family transcriptional regulator